MNKNFKLIIIPMVCLVFLLLVFKYAEEIVDLKHNIYSMFSPAEPTIQVSEPDPDQFEALYASYPTFAHPSDAWYLSTEYIYHAGSGIDGVSYTNSKEAISSAIAHGSIIELDFLYTADNALICAHSWSDISVSDDALTLSEFQELKLCGKYTPMTAEDVIEFMRQHEDIFIVIDTKEPDPICVIQELLRISENQADIADRLIIQLYEADTKEDFLALYPFPAENFLFTYYKTKYSPERILSLCMDEGIGVVTVPYGKWNSDTVDMFTQKGIVLFEHTVNRLDYVQHSREKGISGFYTDFLTT